MAQPGEIRARIRLLTNEEGGRHGPIAKRYHAGIHFPTNPHGGNDGVMTLEDREWCFPGEECLVRIKFLCPEYVQSFLTPGAPFELRELDRTIAKATIVEIL